MSRPLNRRISSSEADLVRLASSMHELSVKASGSDSAIPDGFICYLAILK